MRRHGLVVAVSLLFGASATMASDAKEEAAKTVFKKHCFSCHGLNGEDNGSLGDITDMTRLLVSGKIAAGDVANSRILQRILNEKRPMPPKEDFEGKALPRLGTAEIAAVREWILSRPNTAAALPTAEGGYPTATIQAAILADLQRISDAEKRKTTRYFIFHPVAARGAKAEEIDAVAEAALKVLNSVSWGKAIYAPDRKELAKSLLLRVNLADLEWTDATWTTLLSFSPHTVSAKPGTLIAKNHEAIQKMTSSSAQAYVRADWFAAAGQHPKVYARLLGLTDVAALKKRLKVDDSRDMRAGLLHSGVGLYNRMLRRAESAYGAWWETYDFDVDAERSNIFRFPIGPASAAEGDKTEAFVPAGGEAIFHLPNGLFGYALYQANGQLLETAPTNVVHHPAFNDGIRNFGSCVQCHVSGLLTRTDELWDHVHGAPPGAFQLKTIEQVKASHDFSKFADQVETDNAKYLAALDQLDSSRTKMGILEKARAKYAEPLDRKSFVAEFGEFAKAVPQKYFDLVQTQAQAQKILDEMFKSGDAKASRELADLQVPGLLRSVELTGSLQVRQLFESQIRGFNDELNSWADARRNCERRGRQLPSLAQVRRLTNFTFPNDGVWTRDLSYDSTTGYIEALVAKKGAEGKARVCAGNRCLNFTKDAAKKPNAHLLVRAARLFTNPYFEFFKKDPVGAGFSTLEIPGAYHSTLCVAVE